MASLLIFLLRSICQESETPGAMPCGAPVALLAVTGAMVATRGVAFPSWSQGATQTHCYLILWRGSFHLVAEN